MTAIEAGRSTATKVYKIHLSAGIKLNRTMMPGTASLSRNDTMLHDELDFLVQFEMSNMPVQLCQVRSSVESLGSLRRLTAFFCHIFGDSGFGDLGFGISIVHRK